jgi:hypothetical protein
MHHVADDRPGTDDRHFHDEVVKARWLEPRQGGHLRPRLHLEDADGVGLLQQVVDERVVGRDVREIEA